MYRLKEIVELAFRKYEAHEAMTSHCIAEKYKYQSALSPGKASALTIGSQAGKRDGRIINSIWDVMVLSTLPVPTHPKRLCLERPLCV